MKNPFGNQTTKIWGLNPQSCDHAWEPGHVPPAPPGVEIPFNFCPYCGQDLRKLREVQEEKPLKEEPDCRCAD